MSDSVRPQRRQPTRLLCPRDSPGKNTGVGCHFLPQCMKVKSESEVAQDCTSVQFSRAVVSDSLRPQESQHARPSCHHQLPEFTQTHIHRVSDAIQPSHPLSSPSPPPPITPQIQSQFHRILLPKDYILKLASKNLHAK